MVLEDLGLGGLFGVWEIFLLLDARLAGWFSFDLGLHYSIVFATGFTCKRNWRTTAYHRRSAALEHLWAETGRCFDPDDYWDWPKGSLLGKTPFRMLHCSIGFRSSGKGSNNTDTRGRPHHEHGDRRAEESIAWYLRPNLDLVRMLHTIQRWSHNSLTAVFVGVSAD